METPVATPPVMIYTEATPNPSTLKFVVNKGLLINDHVEYVTAEAAQQSPLAQALFGFHSGIITVFISNNFVTITKSDNDTWAEMMIPVKEFLKQYLDSGKPLFTTEFSTGNKDADKSTAGNNDTESRIRAALEKYVKPAVEMDGGAISFVSFAEGVLTLSLKGSCSGCPSSTVTLKDGIQNLLTRMVPEVKEVVAENG